MSFDEVVHHLFGVQGTSHCQKKICQTAKPKDAENENESEQLFS
jgi:hypothetical protein